MEIEKYRKAGEIGKEVKEYAREIIKKDMLLIDIAEKIESKIIELGGEIAFPLNLSIDEVAAHSTPSPDSKQKVKGLLKIDIGIHVDGYIADTAFSIDLENSEENKKLIEASQEALKEGIKIMKKGIEICEIGKIIQEKITSYGFSPIRNLNGHKLARHEIHAGTNIPNIDNKNKNLLPEGFYAVEPFATTGLGIVFEGKPSGIYKLEDKKPIRMGRDILKFIEQEYNGMPFCSRWLVKKFGKGALIKLKSLEKNNIISQYPQLIEQGNGKVSQAEHTVYISKNSTEILT